LREPNCYVGGWGMVYSLLVEPYLFMSELTFWGEPAVFYGIALVGLLWPREPLF
jgi:hypothetical protein